jgi:predicted phosphoadenosine phosphosulfate sulfurtransferase
VAYARFKWPFNQLYELYYKAGVPLDKQRVASPFLSTAQETLKLYKAIDPNTWGRMLGRVNGVNFTGIYGGTRAMGWQSIKLPKGYTWREYMYFLLETLPEDMKNAYLEKLRVSREFWKYRGGCLSLETIRKLNELGINMHVQKTTNYKTDKLPVQMDYLDDIDIPEFKEIPTYKRMCICILKNDHVCKYMGFALTKKEKQRRDKVMQKYKNIMR